MKIEIKTYKSGMSNYYWTYRVKINGKNCKMKPHIYRLYMYEKTAFDNALRFVKKIAG